MTSTVLFESWSSPPAPRPGWDTYFLKIAKVVADRADCTRRQVGAVIVGEDHRIIETGYNGSPPGQPGCLTDGACPRGRHYLNSSTAAKCACGGLWPCTRAVEPGSGYDTGAGACIAVHAELNALLRAGICSLGATLYCTDWPCGGCIKHIRAAGIARIVTPIEEERLHND